MSPRQEGFDCPQCGAFVRAGRASCPECGSDERTGWQDAEEVDYQSLELPEPDQDQPHGSAARSTVHRVVVVLLVVALVATLVLAV